MVIALYGLRVTHIRRLYAAGTYEAGALGNQRKAPSYKPLPTITGASRTSLPGYCPITTPAFPYLFLALSAALDWKWKRPQRGPRRGALTQPAFQNSDVGGLLPTRTSVRS